MSAGVPIIRALEQIERHPPAPAYRKPLQRLLNEIAKGATLAESLQRLDWLPAFDLALIGAANRADGLTPVSACLPITTTTAPGSSGR